LAFLTLILLVACLGAVVIAAVGVYLPQRAERLFGPSAPGLSLTQRIYLSLQLITMEKDLAQPADPLGTPRPFTVQLGEPTAVLIDRLQAEGFISSAEVFRIYLKYSGLDTSLQAGDYQLSPKMTPVEIAHALQDATPTEVNFHILPGWRKEEIAASLPTSGLDISPEEFLAAAALRPEGLPFSTELPVQASAEGFLFPDSYRLKRETDVQGLLQAFLTNFSLKVNDSFIEGFHTQGLDTWRLLAKWSSRRLAMMRCLDRLGFPDPPGGRDETRFRPYGAVRPGLQP
jgi:UPF0755 protein